MHSRIPWAWAATAAALLALTHARGAGTNAAQLAEGPPDPVIMKRFLDEYAPPKDEFPARYERELFRSGRRTGIDRLGHPSAFQMARHRLKDGYGYHAYMNSRGAGAVRDIAVDALREAVVDELPLEEWEDRGKFTSLRFLSRLFARSVANTVEEDTEPISAEPSEAANELSAEQVARGPGFLDYGFRPWRTTPYLYMSLAIGRLSGDKPVLFNTRLSGQPDSGEIAVMKIQEHVYIPLFDSCRLVLGASVFPLQLDSSELGTSFSVRLEQLFRIGPAEGIWHVGARTTPRESLLLAGISFGW